MTYDGASNLKKALSNVGVNDRVWYLAHQLCLVLANGLWLWWTEKDRKKRREKECDKNVTNIIARTTRDTGDFSDDETDGEDDEDDDDEEADDEEEEEVCSIDADDDIENVADPIDKDVADNTDDENDLVSWFVKISAVVLLRGIFTHELTRVSLKDRLFENIWSVEK